MIKDFNKLPGSCASGVGSGDFLLLSTWETWTLAFLWGLLLTSCT